MLKLNLTLFTLLVFTINSFKCSNADTVFLSSLINKVNVSDKLQIYEDATNNLNFYDILSKPFKKAKTKVPNLGISKSVFWIKIPVKNISNTSKLLLHIAYPSIDFIELYEADELGKYRQIELGEHLPFENRKYKDPDYIFDINIPVNQTKILYLKTHSKEGVQLPISIVSKNELLDLIKNKSILSGIYFGMMLVIILYNLFIYFSVKDKSYLLYVIYVILILLTQTSIQGYPFQYLWPSSPFITQHGLFVFPIFVGISGILFMLSFLKVKTFNKKIHNASYFFYGVYGVSLVFLILKNYKASQTIMEVNAMLVALYMLVTPIIIYRKGFRPAKYFLMAWSVFLIGIVVFVLKDFEVLPFNNLTRYTMQIGSAIEVILLSLALANRINVLKKEKEKSQLETLEALKANEQLVTKQNIILEEKVKERTVELKKTNEELNITLSNLKNTQIQLINAEKMASLGQLTAGIAHEINNPINFVSANIKPLKLNIDDILGLVYKYEKLKSNPENDILFSEIEDYKKEIDFDYLKKEINLLLSGISDGAKRTAEIVSGLKTFARLDEGDVKEVNVNDGIESTLVLLKSSIPPETKLIKELGDLPKIECFPGKLNQVFMNLINNAIYAIKNKNTGNNTLTIKSFYKNEQVYISIEDTGIGMKPEVLNKIYEPFFTTKDVGEGTGLGMAIVFKIIESHNANIEITSDYGIGTKILVILNKKLNYN